MNIIEKLTQINNYMEKRGFHLLNPDGYETLEDISHGFEAGFLDYGDLCYAKSFGPVKLCTLFIHIGRTEKRYRYGWLDGVPFMASHLKVARAWFSLGGHINIKNCDYMKPVSYNALNNSIKLAKRCCESVDKALNRISSHYDY